MVFKMAGPMALVSQDTPYCIEIFDKNDLGINWKVGCKVSQDFILLAKFIKILTRSERG